MIDCSPPTRVLVSEVSAHRDDLGPSAFEVS